MQDIHASADDELFFAAEEESAPSPPTADPWRILVVDDEEEILQVTQLALNDFIFEGRALQLFFAHSAADARKLLRQERDIALILLDVVMEEEDAGLKLVEFIRVTLGNSHIRIVLRTGQPGQAPEREVLLNYDINDYKAKNELTAQKLFTTVVASLRAYRDIQVIEANRQGLRKIIEASSSLFELQSMEKFISGVLQQISAILHLEGNAIFCKLPDDDDAAPTPKPLLIMGATGIYAPFVGKDGRHVLPAQVIAQLESAHREQASHIIGNCFTTLFVRKHQVNSLVYLEGEGNRSFSELDRNLVDLFCANASVAFDNIYLYEQFINSQKAAVTSLSRLAEFKDTDTGSHLRRVEELTVRISERLAQKGKFPHLLDSHFIQQIGMASLLHDVGKVGIPENILLKPDKLDQEEWTVMQLHSDIGGMILEKASTSIRGRNYLALAAEIAQSHHEKYNGKGYPKGLRGEEIPLSARIVAVVDVYDALTTKRPYKEPWSQEKALAWIQQESGNHFDPVVVETLVEILTEEPPHLV